MLLVAIQPAPDAVEWWTFAIHQNGDEAVVLADPAYAGMRLYRYDGGAAAVNRPVPDGASWLNAPESLFAYAKRRRKEIVEGPGDGSNGRYIRIAISTGTRGFYLDLQARTSILGARTSLLLPEGDSYKIEKWFYPDGTSEPLVGMDIERAALFVGQVFQATFTTLSTVVAGIAAGTVTTRDQVDAAFEALLSPVYGG